MCDCDNCKHNAFGEDVKKTEMRVYLRNIEEELKELERLVFPKESKQCIDRAQLNLKCALEALDDI